ncbi:MAG: LacI family DNA-binding transcriptional regulator, partial [Bacteroidota bacterium]
MKAIATMHKRQVTLADLARELGISTATVSRALKDYPDISQHTKDRVLELARKLKYQP